MFAGTVSDAEQPTNSELFAAVNFLMDQKTCA